MSIASIGNSLSPVAHDPLRSFVTDEGEGSTSFLQVLQKQIGTVDSLLAESDKKATEVAIGKSENLHDAMISYEKAESALKLLVQVRNKAIDAYNEVLRMQV